MHWEQLAEQESSVPVEQVEHRELVEAEALLAQRPSLHSPAPPTKPPTTGTFVVSAHHRDAFLAPRRTRQVILHAYRTENT